MIKKEIKSEIALQGLIGDMREAFKASEYLKVTYSDSRPRSLDQNALSHTWFAQVARELREDTELGVKCFCKLNFGVPILRADDEEFRALYDSVIKPLPYEKKLKAMGLLPISSNMNTDQLSRYLQCVKDHYACRVDLQFPPDPAEQAPEHHRKYKGD